MYKRAFYILLALIIVSLPAASAAAAPATVTRAYAVDGSDFRPTASSITYTYPSHGCLTSSGLFHAPVNLPDGSVVTQVIFEYNNTSALPGPANNASLIEAWYSGGFHSISYSVGSEISTGYHISSQAINVTIDNTAHVYYFNWLGYGASQQDLCVMRVVYTPPSIFGVALPVVRQ